LSWNLNWKAVKSDPDPEWGAIIPKR